MNKKQIKRKTIQELTITDDFMFGAVMSNEDNCRELLEMILGIPIEKVEVIREKSLIYNPEYKGIRLDAFAKDDKGTRFDVEIQVRSTPILKRSRYYHSQMDMEMLLSGIDYTELPDSFVIFICCYDPWERGIYRYTIENSCRECPDLDVGDGVHTIVLNNNGKNPEDISPGLVRFLEFTKKTLAESEDISDDPYIRQIQKSIRDIKSSREMGEKYMKLQEMLKEEWKEGHKEGLKEGLKEGQETGFIKSVYIQKVLNNTLSIAQAADMLNMTAEEFQELMDSYQELQASLE